MATGRAGPGSDVDFLVEMERERSLLDFAGFCIDLRELLGCRVDVVEKGGESPYMSKKILSEAVPL